MSQSLPNFFSYLVFLIIILYNICAVFLLQISATAINSQSTRGIKWTRTLHHRFVFFLLNHFYTYLFSSTSGHSSFSKLLNFSSLYIQDFKKVHLPVRKSDLPHFFMLSHIQKKPTLIPIAKISLQIPRLGKDLFQVPDFFSLMSPYYHL